MREELTRPPAPPAEHIDGDGPSTCPECGHERGKPYYDPYARLARWWRTRRGLPAKASRRPACEWEATAMAGTCGCSNPFHST